MHVHAGGKGEGETPTALANSLEQLFAVVMHQKIQCLGRESASKVEESISYQVPLYIHHASIAALCLESFHLCAHHPDMRMPCKQD